MIHTGCTVLVLYLRYGPCCFSSLHNAGIIDVLQLEAIVCFKFTDHIHFVVGNFIEVDCY
jgi:hypothetical protein